MSPVGSEDDPGGKGGGDEVKITESYLGEFADQKLKWLIDDFDASEPRATVKLYAGGGGDGKSGTNHLLAGTSVDGNPAPGSLVTALGTYAGALDTYFGALSLQAVRLREDLKHASWALNDGHEEALTAAQLMWLIDDVLKGGNPGGSTTAP
ncbi:hypothetical protein GCM10009759_25340 [Kitasatospora saccharophila]|uniref:Uncharacterized protein n=1 Tax=Kitasatospora saccharophila TaxID=407973 RepID=A0ABN2WQV9_9ACTN